MSWHVQMTFKTEKTIVDARKTPIDVKAAAIILMNDLRMFGPAVDWPNYGKLKNQGIGIDRRHCHLQKGRPTWVACWEVHSKHRLIEVYYVGTHEKAPY